MAAKQKCSISFFPVGNGGMALIQLESGSKILIDCNIREAADNPDDITPDVYVELRERLDRDAQGRLYVDAFLLSHPDEDHCNGLKEHFHLGLPDQWSKQEDKIFIREIWSSPMVFRRASRENPLCDDAKAFNAEAKRRVGAFRKTGVAEEGDRILILSEDEEGKTDGLERILVRPGEEFARVNGAEDNTVRARLLGPQPKSNDDEEDIFSKNNSSVVLNFSLTGDSQPDCCRFLTGGDAQVEIWERLWEHCSCEDLLYDVLLAPHHCSWHSLSHDSWSKSNEEPKVSQNALNALSQVRTGATVVASSEPIKDDDNDPPCIGAKREYEKIVRAVGGEFLCVGEEPSEMAPGVMEIQVSRGGHQHIRALSASSAIPLIRKPIRHG